MEVYDGGVDVPQVDDPGVTITLLVQDGVGTDEEEDSDTHDQGSQDLQLVRVQVPAVATGGRVGQCIVPQEEEVAGLY